ncbi:Pectinesterase [Zostera marina]|uniref:Pectinesterase n=1 Tax=Zostera marina TaxID=29655 RepID=A0A0K9PEH4_ZOSMR|nr:Pectinesterase [Zostera marina]
MSATNYFIRNSCTTTLFPQVCTQTLSDYTSSSGGALPHHSERRIAKIGLSVSLIRTKTAYGLLNQSLSTLVSDDRERGIISDCVQEMKNSVYHLSKSIRQLEKMGSAKNPAFAYRLGNIQTWASAALTEVTTCVGGLEKSEVDVEFKSMFDEVTKVISNALALVNQIVVPVLN